nr:TonB-dependent receptor [Sphingomonas sp. CDS-1]
MLNTRFVGLLGVSVLALSAPAAWAQEASQANSGGQLQDIVVTAQRKAERLQDVPISINAISGETMASRGVTNTFDLQTVVPGLSITRVATVSTPYLRGVGSDGANPNQEASVATYVDGVYYAAPFGNLFSFNNIDRVEVLKGPQGTLFGRNATGGVIQIITRRPSQNASAEIYGGYANYDTYEAGGYATTGLSENLAMDVAVQYRNQRDGWGRNTFLDLDSFKGKEFAIRSKLLFTPGDRTEITLTGDYAFSRNSFNTYNRAAGIPDADGVVRNPGRYDSNGDTLSDARTRQHGVALRVEHDLDFAKFVSISAYRNNKGYNLFDYDTSPLQIVSPVTLFQKVKTLSQEVQLISQSGSAFDWTIGAYYFDSKPEYSPSRLCGVGIVPSGCLDIYGLQHTKSLSGYAQATVKLTDATRLTGGIRYTHETQKLTGGFQSFDDVTGTASGPFGAAPVQRQKFSEPTWRIALDHELSRDVKVYASWNRGLKSGGFNLQGPGGPGYAPEFLDAYEVGLKSELMDRRIRLNVAGFWYDFKDIQVAAIRGTTATTVNAAKARMKGIDADFAFAVTPELTINANGAYVDGKFRDFPNPAVYPASILDPSVTLANADGLPTTRTPKFTGSVGFDYAVPTQIGKISLSSNLYHNSGFSWEASNRYRQKSYELLNASVGWTSENDRFSVRVWGQNLTDAKYLAQGVSSAIGDLRSFASPRTYGVTLTTRFGS